jgi:regulatory protein
MFAEKSPPKKIRLSPKEALVKIQSYCAYQERSHKEVKNKLFEYGLYASEVDELISNLIVDGFLNEERFAKAFAGGKFRIKKWGRLKIQQELEMLGLTKRNIARQLNQILSRKKT